MSYLYSPFTSERMCSGSGEIPVTQGPCLHTKDRSVQDDQTSKHHQVSRSFIRRENSMQLEIELFIRINLLSSTGAFIESRDMMASAL